MRLKGKVAIITGATRGIGKGIVEFFAKEGALVVLASRNKDVGERLAREIPNGSFFETDVREEKAVESLINQTVKLHGRIDVVVNNASIYPDEGDISKIKLETFRDIVDSNFTSAFLLTKWTLPHLKESRGNIINIGSIRGLRPKEDVPIYSSTKAAVLMLTKASALIHGKDGIRVNCICPGPIDTEGIREVFTDEKELDEFLLSNVLEKRGSVEDVAKFAVFLASDDASFVTGGIYTVDGGSYLLN